MASAIAIHSIGRIFPSTLVGKLVAAEDDLGVPRDATYLDLDRVAVVRDILVEGSIVLDPESDCGLRHC